MIANSSVLPTKRLTGSSKRSKRAADVDCSMTGDGVLEVECADGSKIIVNRHLAAREIWVAARAGGFHFRWSDEEWRDTRSGQGLLASLSALLSAQSGQILTLG